MVPQLHSSDRGSMSPLCGSCRFSGESVEETVVSHSCSLSSDIPHVFLDKVVDMPVIVNDRVLHSGGASIQLIVCLRGHSSCATQTTGAVLGHG